jgi:hypothetical protein
MKRLLVVSLLAAAVAAPAATAKTITVATSSGVTPSDSININNTVSPVPRSITIFTSGPITEVTASISCRNRKRDYYSSTARDNRAGRLALGHDHTMSRCTVEATASAKSAKPGRPFKIALQIER